jgi:hypothetical protein
MSNYAPIWLNFNGGEVSPAMRGRVDHEKYNSWLERVKNFILTPQGMLTKRPGSIMTGTCQDSDFDSELIPFEYSQDENYILEFGKTHIAFWTNDGRVLETSGAGTVTNSTRITKAAHGYNVGDLVYLSGMASSNQNGRTVKITAKTSNTFDWSGALDVSSGAVTVARVYRITHPYDQADLANIQFEQAGNVMRITHDGYQNRKLVRSSNTSWTLTAEDLTDGPYGDVNAGATKLTLSGSGDLARKAGVTKTVSSTSAAANGGFLGNPGTYWRSASGAENNCWMKVDLGVGQTAKVQGYVLFAPSISPEEVAPASWRLEGSNDNVTWALLHTGNATEAWAPAEGKFFEIPPTKAYRYFRLFIEGPWANASNFTAVGWWGLLAHPDFGGEVLNLTADSVSDINDGQGFVSGDVGRPIRFLTSRGYYIWGRISSFSSTTSVGVQLQNFPFGDDYGEILTFQLGVYSSGAGWPNSVAFFQNRMVFAGGTPLRVTMSENEVFTSFKPTDPEGTVTDSDGINARPTARRADGVVWLTAVPGGVAVGTKSGEWVVRAATSDRVLAPSNIDAAEHTRWGSKAGIRPAKTDGATLFIDKTGKALREFAYVYEIDAFRAPSMNLLADHVFTSPCVSLAYQASPHSILWAARQDGGLRALTYNRENDIVGWSTHELGGVGDSEDNPPEVTKVCVVTNTNGDADDVYMVVKRYINGAEVRYIERFAQYFDDETDKEDAFFVDCGLTYDGAASSTIGGLWHLEGETVVALADGVICRDLTVTDGEVTLPREASKVQIGYAIESIVKTLPVRGGALDGTAQGRQKRTWQIVIDFWKTWGGSYGPDETRLEEIGFLDPFSGLNNEASALFTGYKGPYSWPGGHEMEAAVCYVHSDPTPCNIRGFMPRNELTDHG